MTPERWQQVHAVFAEAQCLVGAERAMFLDRACAGDDPLRAEVEQLLDHDECASRSGFPFATVVTKNDPTRPYGRVEYWIGLKFVGASKCVSAYLCPLIGNVMCAQFSFSQMSFLVSFAPSLRV